MLPTPETRFWSRSWRLTPELRRRTRRTTSSPSNSGSRGSRAMWAISGGRSAPPAETDRPPNIRWSTKRSSRPSSAPSSASRTRRCRSSGASGGWTSSCPLMPRWPSRASPLSSGSQRYLPRRRAASIRRPVSAAANPAGPRRSRRTGRGCRTSTRTIVAPRTCRSTPARTTSTSGSSGTALVRGGRGVAGEGLAETEALGDLAVRSLRGGLLGLLLRPADAVAVEALAHADLGGEGLHVVRALVRDDVLGHPEAALGGELLEGVLPARAAAERGGGLDQRVEEPVHALRGGLEAAAQVHRTDDRLDRVGDDRGL